MPFYDVECEKCGTGEVRCSMQDAQAAGGMMQCAGCSGPALRVYRVPYEKSDNLFPGGGRWSHQLSEGGDPVFISTKSEERQLMNQKGVTHWEKGMQQSKPKSRRVTKDQFLRKLQDVRSIELR